MTVATRCLAVAALPGARCNRDWPSLPVAVTDRVGAFANGCVPRCLVLSTSRCSMMNAARRSVPDRPGAASHRGAMTGVNRTLRRSNSAAAQALRLQGDRVRVPVGGNDSNNMIVPYHDYAAYAAVRTTAAMSRSRPPSRAFIAARAGNRAYGFHPALAPITPRTHGASSPSSPMPARWSADHPADYLAGRYRPPNLFSHWTRCPRGRATCPVRDCAQRLGRAHRGSDTSLNSGLRTADVMSVSGTR